MQTMDLMRKIEIVYQSFDGHLFGPQSCGVVVVGTAPT